MKLYDPKFVHFEWSDKLDEQYCFVADNINRLIERVNSNDTAHLLKVSKGNEYYPFECGEDRYRFAYYDPNYEVKYAYWEMGYDIYVTLRNRNIDWIKIEKEETFLDYIDDPDYEFKIDDDFTELREAYKQGKTIQHMNLDGDWVDCDVPGFSANHSYRVKPEEKINKGSTLDISDKGFGESEDTLYRPFKDTNELIAYWEKHYSNGNRPEYTMPLIWVKHKLTGNFYLILGFGKDGYEEESILVGNRISNMKELFDNYEFLDDKCCGKVKE